MPGPTSRAKLRSAYGIPTEAWGQEPAAPAVPEYHHDEPATGERRAPGPSPRAPDDTGPGPGPALPSTMAGVDALLAVTRQERAKHGLLASERVKLVDAEQRLLALRHRLEKEAELLEDRIVKQHPMWSRIEALLARTLVRWPEAARAVAAALKELGE